MMGKKLGMTLSTRARAALLRLLPDGSPLYHSSDADLLQAVKVEVLRKYKRNWFYAALLKQEGCGESTAREVCGALGLPATVPKKPWPKPKIPKSRPTAPVSASTSPIALLPQPRAVPLPRPQLLSKTALKILTSYVVGRTGVRYFDVDDALICAVAASLDPPIADRDLLNITGCGRGILHDIRRELAKFAPVPKPAPNWSHLVVTFKLRAVKSAEVHMLAALRNALDSLIACAPLSGSLVVSSATVTELEDPS
jgi:hypothetical protein